MEESKDVVVNEFQAPVAFSQVAGNMAVEQSKAVAETFGAIMSAKRFPRDSFTAFNSIMKECERYQLAEVAVYSYPRGGATVSGPSIRMAEAIARCWGNIDCGVRELERRDGESVMQAYAYDLETNYRQTRNFTVKHERYTKKGSYKLEDPRDIYEATANYGARRMRACILALIPGDVIEAAKKKVSETLVKGPQGVTREDRIRNLIAAFDKIGVPIDAIEKRLGHSKAAIVDEEIVDLIGAYNAIKDNMGKRQDFFDLGQTVASEAAQTMTEALKAEKAAQQTTLNVGK